MLEDATRQGLLRVLEDLQKDLEKKNAQLIEFDEIRNERDRIASLIQHIKEELGLEAPEIMVEGKGQARLAPIQAGGPLTFLQEKPIKEGISEIFDEFKRRMEVNEIVAEFRKRGWKLSENNPQEVIRSALKRNPSLFRKVSRGNWEKIRRRAIMAPPPISQGGEIK